MKNVWVIEQGQYSDYRVVGVFSSEKNAQKVCEAINKGDRFDEATVSCWPVDPAIDELNAGLSRYALLMLKDGTVERIRPIALSSYSLESESRIWKRTNAAAYKGTDVQDCLDATVWAKDETHAIKVANEMRTGMIAHGRWK